MAVTPRPHQHAHRQAPPRKIAPSGRIAATYGFQTVGDKVVGRAVPRLAER